MSNRLSFIFLFVLLGFLFVACTPKTVDLSIANPKSDVYYELFVRSFADSDGNGIGDFNGITEKLSYFQEIGVTGLWLMPIQPAGSYHGYDVMDYYDVNADYGTMADFENLVSTADSMGIRIMLDMVFNHTSNQHPWFIAALNGDEKYQDYYDFINFTTNTSKLLGSWGQTIWHTSNNLKYCGYFSYTMPDLNFYSEAVKAEILNITKFWIDKGVGGFRLDAVHHYFGENEYINVQTSYFDNIAYLTNYQKAVEEYSPDFYITGEVYIEDLYQVVGNYFSSVDSPIDFPVATKIRTAVDSTSNRTYVSSLETIYDYYRRVNSDFISAPFIVNHDMDRLASNVSGNIATLKLSSEMLLTLPGNPIIYYGEEIGMFGYKASGPDIWDETRRLPLLWGDEYTTDWLVSSNLALSNLNLQNEAVVNVNNQLLDSDSLLSTYSAMIHLRENNIALMYGNSFTAYEENTSALQGFYREYQYDNEHQKILVLHNFSDVEIDMITYNGNIIYASSATDLSTVTSIPARGTVVIDITIGDKDA
jgi:glycosidase